MRWVYLFIMVAGLASCAWAQYPVDSTNTQAAAFAYDVYCLSNDTTGRVDVYIQIPYASLVFIHEFDKYSAKYAVIVQFRSRTDSIVTEKSYPEVLTEKTFENASGRSKKVVFLQKVFALPVGDYTVEMTLSDENAHTMKPYLQKGPYPGLRPSSRGDERHPSREQDPGRQREKEHYAVCAPECKRAEGRRFHVL